MSRQSSCFCTARFRFLGSLEKNLLEGLIRGWVFHQNQVSCCKTSTNCENDCIICSIIVSGLLGQLRSRMRHLYTSYYEVLRCPWITPCISTQRGRRRTSGPPQSLTVGTKLVPHQMSSVHVLRQTWQL